MRWLKLSVNVAAPQSTNQLMVSVSMNCLIIPLDGMPYPSESSSRDYLDGPEVRTSPSSFEF